MQSTSFPVHIFFGRLKLKKRSSKKKELMNKQFLSRSNDVQSSNFDFLMNFKKSAEQKSKNGPCGKAVNGASFNYLSDFAQKER